MNERLMVLPSREPSAIRLVKIPDDIEPQEAYRHVTGVISSVEEALTDYDWDDIEDALDEHGYQRVKFILGPALD